MQRLLDYSNLMLELNLRPKQRWGQRSRRTSRPKEKLLQHQKLMLNLKEKERQNLKLMLKLKQKQKLDQKQKVKLMSRVRQMPTLMLRDKQINLNLVIWANLAATLILSITLVKKLLDEDIKLMSINGPITIQEV